MKWQKKGFICSSETIELPWYKKNTMVPLPYLIDSKRLRIFVTMCDAQNVGRIGYVDVDPEDPSEIFDFSKNPILDVGTHGSFSDNGVLTSSLLELEGKLYLYYSAYQSCVKIPYLIFSGVAVSEDRGSTFTNLTSAPLLDRVDNEIFVRSSPSIMKVPEGFKVWYSSDSGQGWVRSDSKARPCYDMKHIVASSPSDWPRVRGVTSIALQNEDEHGITKATFWKEDGLYKAIYAIRSLSKGYRLGYAESSDGIQFERKDDQVGIDVSDTGWDSEMITFPERYSYQDRTFLFYCGNHYGMAGMGYAELIDKD
jgi:predicted GH43/DUF377 family glycosyl hydrolase